MTTITYGMKCTLGMGVEEAEAQVREALAAEGFGILTEIDVAATFSEKLGIERTPYRILGACNPSLADRAIEAEADAGLLLPCNVTIYEDGDRTVVAILDPATMVDLTGNPALAAVAGEAASRLSAVIQSIADSSP